MHQAKADLADRPSWSFGQIHIQYACDDFEFGEIRLVAELVNLRKLAAARIVAGICDLINILETDELAHMGRPGLVEGTRKLIEYPYIIVYQVHEDRREVVVLSIVHGAQDPRTRTSCVCRNIIHLDVAPESAIVAPAVVIARQHVSNSVGRPCRRTARHSRPKLMLAALGRGQRVDEQQRSTLGSNDPSTGIQFASDRRRALFYKRLLKGFFESDDFDK